MTLKSDRIQRLLADEDLQEAFQQVKDAIHRGWANAPPTKLDEQQEWHRRLFTLKSVEENLRIAIQDGKLEDFRAEQDKKPSILGDIAAWRMKHK